MNNFIQMVKGFKNPKQAVFQMMKNNQNPILSDLIKKVENGDTQAVENFARNMMKEQGRDFDDEIQQFMNQFK